MILTKIKFLSIFVLVGVLVLALGACDLNGDGNGEESTMYTLTIETEGGGTTEPEPGSYEYEENTVVDIKAIAEEGYEFAKWEGDVVDSESPETKVNLNSDMEVTAVFEEILQVKFKVVDENEDPLERALIKFDDLHKETDEKGEVTFEAVSGIYEYSVSKRGYMSEEGKEKFKDEIEVEEGVFATEEVILKKFVIQEAIDNAESGDEIIVPPGTYYENISFEGKTIALVSSNPEFPRHTVIDGNGDRVIEFINGEGEETRLEGFTIRNGEAEYGGGILIGDGSSPTIAGNIISENKSEHNGGGITIAIDSSPLIEDNIIRNNESQYIGGGIAVGEDSSPRIEDNIIENNYSKMSGGGLVIIDNSNPQLISNEIIYNSADHMGGGIAMAQEANPEIRGNKIDNNQSDDAGAGILVTGESSPVIEDNEIGSNWSFYTGGGIAVGGASTPQIYDNRLANNSTFGLGGGIFIALESEILDDEGKYWQRENSPPYEEPHNEYEANEHGGDADYGADVYFRSEETESEMADLVKDFQIGDTIIPQDIPDFDYKKLD